MEHGLYMKHLKVEVYLLKLKLSLHPKLNEPVNKFLSHADNIGTPCSLYRAVSFLCFLMPSLRVLFLSTQLILRLS